MCFSANASFITAAGLSIISLLSFKKSSIESQKIPLAISPFFFAIQQACEGIVWITLNDNNSTSLLHKIGMYGFLFFAACWWPMWIPYSLFIIEKKRSLQKLLLITLYIGIFSAFFLLLSWILQTTGAQIINHHIDYPVTHYPFGIINPSIAQLITWIIALSYCIATIIPFFISTIPYIWILGMTITIGLLASYLFYYVTLPSIWCFFAAISSIIIYFIL